MTRLPGRELLSPLPLAALAVMILNDHVLRSRWPSWLTGKLSDFAVVLYFPFLLTATLGILLWLADRVADRATSGGRRINHQLAEVERSHLHVRRVVRELPVFAQSPPSLVL